MIKVFLVEDETIVRQGLRDKFPWQQYGYEFAGEASDGEMALPMIQKIKPDVLLTDIKMPFMDGLSLSKIVHKELPDTKIIVISGHDDFEYAREAISAGVEQYLLKPITRMKMQEVLLQLRDKIEQEKQEKQGQSLSAIEQEEYEQYIRSTFFMKMLEGHTPLNKIYEEALQLSISLQADCYNLVLFCLLEKRNRLEPGFKSEEFLYKKEELLYYFSKNPDYLCFQVNMNTYGVLVKGTETSIDENVNRCISQVKKICEPTAEIIDYYLAVSQPVNRISLLPECYNNASNRFAYRFIMPQIHVFDENVQKHEVGEKNLEAIGNLDTGNLDPEILKGFLATGSILETDAFVDGYMEGMSDAAKSQMFRNYLFYHVRFTTLAFVESISPNAEEFKKEMDEMCNPELIQKSEDLKDAIHHILKSAIARRDQESSLKNKNIIDQAKEYIETNYANEGLTLNEAASKVGVSPNYLSALFSRGIDKTFTEYLTERRMEAAKKLLRTKNMSTAEVAALVGYRDSHYFSSVFKKTQGMTTKEYRNQFWSE